MSAQSKKSGGSRKVGRNGAMCKVYRDRNVRLRNKVRKVLRHIKRYPGDEQAQAWMDAK